MKLLDKDQILASDNHIFVVVKPSNLLTQKEEGRDSLQGICEQWLKQELKKEKIFLEPIHRLDKAVSGIVIFARSSKALSRLQEAMRKREISREYVAWVEGIVRKDKGQLTHFLIHDAYRARITEQQEKNAEKAELFYEVLERKEKTTKLKIILKTGKYHQIRAQFSFIGHPICGDQKYGSSKKMDCIQLHHQKTEFFHPVTKKLLIFFSPPQF